MDATKVQAIYEKLSRSTLWGMLSETAARLPDKLAVVCGDRRLTYAELVRRVESLSEGFSRAGFRRGDMAAIYMKNSLEFVTVFYALERLGVSVAWLNPNYREKEARFILGNSGAKAVFVFGHAKDFDYLGTVLGLHDELPELETVVAAGMGADCPDGVRRLEDFFVDGPVAAAPALDPDDLAMLIYTSGTTGRPKGAMLSHSQAVRGAFSYSLGTAATQEDIFIAFLPMAHSYGCGALLVQPFLLGATVVLMEAFAPQRAFELIQAERVTIQLGSPAHYIMELNSPVRGEYDLTTLRAGLIAGQIAPEGLITRVEREMGLYISSFLGASEVGPGLSIILPPGTDLATREIYIGYPIHGTKIRIIDPVNGEDRPDGEPGELLLSGWHVMSGYWKNPEETANQLRNGWLHTGDLVVRNGEGPVRILGRMKECINRGGLKIIPSELEGLFMRHPAVGEVVVVGTPNPVLGESTCVVLKPAPGQTPPTLRELRDFIAGEVAPFKLPDELLVLEEMPRLSGGLKLNRFGPGGVTELARTSATKETFRK